MSNTPTTGRRKASRANASHLSCVDAATAGPACTLVRDSTNPTGGHVAIDNGDWLTFLTATTD